MVLFLPQVEYTGLGTKGRRLFSLLPLMILQQNICFLSLQYWDLLVQRFSTPKKDCFYQGTQRFHRTGINCKKTLGTRNSQHHYFLCCSILVATTKFNSISKRHTTYLKNILGFNIHSFGNSSIIQRCTIYTLTCPVVISFPSEKWSLNDRLNFSKCRKGIQLVVQCTGTQNFLKKYDSSAYQSLNKCFYI